MEIYQRQSIVKEEVTHRWRTTDLEGDKTQAITPTNALLPVTQKAVSLGAGDLVKEPSLTQVGSIVSMPSAPDQIRARSRCALFLSF